MIFHKGRTSYNRQLAEKARFEKNVIFVCSMHQKYERDSISGSIRSHNSLNLHELLPQLFEGLHVKWWGHTNACGFQLPQEKKEELISKIEQYFNSDWLIFK